MSWKIIQFKASIRLYNIYVKKKKNRRELILLSVTLQDRCQYESALSLCGCGFQWS